MELTRREAEVLGLVAEGLKNFEIGKKLFIEEQTVKFHVSNILRKLRAKNRPHAVMIALRNGTLKGDDMSYTLNVTGHCDTKEGEDEVVLKLRDVIPYLDGVNFAEFISNNQTVNLLEKPSDGS